MKRHVVLLGVAVAALAATVAALVVAGRADPRSVLYSGVSTPLGMSKMVITDAAAARDGRMVRSNWLRFLEGAVPTGQSGGVSPRQFRSRLATAADRYGFTVKRVEFTHHSRVAPLVVVQTDRYVAFARAASAVESSLDPHSGGSIRDEGWAFPAFFLEAEDERGVPFLIVHNVMPTGGGQWARSDQLYPFLHG